MANISLIEASEYTQCIGGIAGRICTTNKATVRNCANYGSIFHSGSVYSILAGGIISKADEKYGRVFIENCLNYGTISSVGEGKSSSRLGGIAGYPLYATITNCVSAGKIIPFGDNDAIGAITGMGSSDTKVAYCFWTVK